MILKEKYTTYTSACKSLATQTLHDRRENPMFQTVNTNISTRQKKKKVSEFKCNTTRFYKSSLPYLARLLNDN